MIRRSKTYYGKLLGAWVNVPLHNIDFLGKNAWCLGLITHVGFRGLCVGHFFLPEFAAQGMPEWHKGLTQKDAVLLCITSDEGVVREEWPIVGSFENWSENQKVWPTPPFHYGSPPHCVLRHYEDDLATFATVPTDCEIALEFPRDSLWGYQSIEDHLRSLVRKRLEEEYRQQSLRDTGMVE